MQGTASPGTGSYPGVHSPRLKAARRLNKRAFRQRERAFLAEGPQAVAEAFHCGARVTDLFVTVPARTRHGDLVAAIATAGIPVHVVSGEVMDELAQTVTPQGLLAVCGFVDVPLAETSGKRGGIHNSLTRILVKPSHLIGGYAQLTFAFNYLGPTGNQRDEVTVIRKRSQEVTY